MRRVVLLLVPLFLFACDREPVAADPEITPAFGATSEWTDEVMDLPAGDDKYYADCVDDWFDEVGPLVWRYHTVTTATGVLFFAKLRFLDGFHIVGDNTGTWNLAVPNEGGTWVERIPAGQGTYTLTYALAPYLFVSEQSGTTILWPSFWKVTITADGTVTANHFFEQCHVLGK